MQNPFQIIMDKLNELETKIDAIKPEEFKPYEKPELMGIKELCEFLNVTSPTLARWRQKGKIPYMTIGTAVRFDKKKVLEALENKIDKTTRIKYVK